MEKKYDEHAGCRAEIARILDKTADRARIKQVVQRLPNDRGHVVLNVIRVDAFEDGLRVLVE
jgi:hypothetical protein